MRVTRHPPDKHIQFEYTLHQQRLEQDQSAKYLGITISDDLDWGQHISEISSKATKTLGFLRRNLAFAPRHTKEVAYKTLVRPKLEYAAPIWHSYHETQIGQVEKVQRTAARWTCRKWRNTSSVGDMLDDLEWPSLETRREQSSLTFFYKIHSGTVDLDKDKYLTPAPNLRRTRASHESQYTRYFAYSDALKNSFLPRTIPKIVYGLVAVPLPNYIQPTHRISRYCHSMTYRQIQTSTNYYKYSFFPLAIVQWNALPEAVASLPDLDLFKVAVSKLQHTRP